MLPFWRWISRPPDRFTESEILEPYGASCRAPPVRSSRRPRPHPRIRPPAAPGRHRSGGQVEPPPLALIGTIGGSWRLQFERRRCSCRTGSEEVLIGRSVVLILMTPDREPDLALVPSSSEGPHPSPSAATAARSPAPTSRPAGNRRSGVMRDDDGDPPRRPDTFCRGLCLPLRRWISHPPDRFTSSWILEPHSGSSGASSVHMSKSPLIMRSMLNLRGMPHEPCHSIAPQRGADSGQPHRHRPLKAP